MGELGRDRLQNPEFGGPKWQAWVRGVGVWGSETKDPHYLGGMAYSDCSNPLLL